MDPIIREIYDAVLAGHSKAVEAKVPAALSAGLAPQQILEEGMIAAMAEVGRLFEQGEYFVPEMLIAARAMQSGLALLKPSLKAGNVQSAGRVAIGSVQGDTGEVRRGGDGEGRPDRRVVRPAYYHDVGHENHDRRAGAGRRARQDQGHGGWRPDHGDVRPADRRRRLRPGCQPRGGAGEVSPGGLTNHANVRSR